MLLPGLRLEKHAGNGERMSAWSEFILICALLSHSQPPQQEREEGKKNRFIELQSGEKHKPASVLNKRKRATPD